MIPSYRQLLAVLLLALAAMPPLAARSFDDIKASKELLVSVYRDFAPYSSLIAGKPSGIDIDIAAAIASSLGVRLQLRWITADENVEDDLRNSLWKGDFRSKKKSDLMLRVPYDRQYSQLRDDIGELVHDRVHMFAPYHIERWQIAFNRQKMAKVPTIALFQYHDIGVEVDTVPAFYLTTAFRGSMTKHTKHFSNMSLAVAALKQHEVDAVMGMRTQISHLLHGSDANFVLAANGFPTLGKQQWQIGMAVKSDYRQLAYAIEDIVAALVTSGKMQAIFTRHHALYQAPSFYNDNSG